MPGNPSGVRRPRWPRLQFSLRLLLLALTAFAIGFPIWYRWPYTEEDADGIRTITWQRQWGGGRLKHGKQTLTQGKLVQISNYRRDKTHGPYLMKVGDRIVETGQFVDGLREGRWTYQGTTVLNWHRGKLDGKCELKSPRSAEAIVMFDAGRLTHINAAPVEDHLFDLLQSNAIDERTASELKRDTIMEMVEVPLKDTVLYLQEAHNIPIGVDLKQIANPTLPITTSCIGMELGSALTFITAPRGLACDYRYGRLWITTAGDARNWHDPTGVAAIRPPEESALARAWNVPATAAVTTLPLAQILTSIARPLAISLDTSEIAPTTDRPNAYPAVSNTDGLSFRDALGMLLYETGCRCELEGETLVILPPENKNE